MNSIVFLILCSFGLSFWLTPLFRQFALWKNWVDQPDQRRKMHTVPIARIGGLPIMLAYGGALGLLLFRPHFSSTGDASFPLLWVLLPGSLLVLGTGLLDDIVGLKPWQKLLGQFLAAGLVYLCGIRIQSLGGHPFGAVLAFVITMLWLVGCTNAFNLIDGLDGLATGIGLIACLTSLLGGLANGDMGLVLATAPLIGALLGFLLFNFNPASIFLGDGGSLWVGFMLACYGVIWCQKSVTALSITAPMMTMCIPLLDTALSVIRRFLRGQPIFTADRGHIHHRLLDRGFTPRRVTLLLYAASGVGAVFSFLQSTASNPVRALIIAVFCVIVWTGIHNLGYKEFGLAARFLRRNVMGSMIDSHFFLSQCEQLLKRANTIDECWEALGAVAITLGFSEIELHVAGKTYHKRVSESVNGNWVVLVPLATSAYIRIGCQFEVDKTGPAIAPFADLLHRCLSPKMAAVAFNLPRPANIRSTAPEPV